jgi:galactose oxidase-like protein
MEIYSPPYLFNPDGTPAARPTITSTSASVIGSGGESQVRTPDAANISSIVLMRNGAVTHAFDMDQRNTPSFRNLANPGSVTYATPGTYVTTFTVTDNAGKSPDPHLHLPRKPLRKVAARRSPLQSPPELALPETFRLALADCLPGRLCPLVPRPSPRPAPAR